MEVDDHHRSCSNPIVVARNDAWVTMRSAKSRRSVRHCVTLPTASTVLAGLPAYIPERLVSARLAASERCVSAQKKQLRKHREYATFDKELF